MTIKLNNANNMIVFKYFKCVYLSLNHILNFKKNFTPKQINTVPRLSLIQTNLNEYTHNNNHIPQILVD